MVQFVECLTLDFSLGHDPRVVRSSSASGSMFIVQCRACFGSSLSLCPSPPLMCSLSLSFQNTHTHTHTHRKRERERERERERVSQSQAGSMQGSIPSPWDHDLSQNQEWVLQLTEPPRRPETLNYREQIEGFWRQDGQGMG